VNHQLSFSLFQTLPPFRRVLGLALLVALLASGCIPLTPAGPTAAPSAVDSTPAATPTAEPTPLPAIHSELAETQVVFRVQVPADTPAGTTVYLTLLDEVTGLALNAVRYPMQELTSDELQDLEVGSQRVYQLSLPAGVGSMLKYRYERLAGDVTVSEHVSAGNQVRYRLYHVEGPGEVLDVVGRWTDTPFSAETGRIQGTVVDRDSGQPLASVLVTAGGQQTLSAADGSFLLEGLPPGVHNLVAMAIDGAYQAFQQGARVEAGATTPAPLQMIPARPVQVTFLVSLPENTPPVVPVRMAGNLYQLGNTFADLAGGTSSLAENMPVLTALPDGRYTLNLTLPAGTDLRYKYTLGDGFWNAEHSADGAFQLRQLVVPDQDEVVVEDQVISWQAGSKGRITFDLSAPGTPPGEQVSIQFRTLFGWTQPVPMWQLGESRWAYILYSPLNLPGELGYRYCHNGHCEPEDPATLRVVTPEAEPQLLNDVIEAWPQIAPQESSAPVPAAEEQAEILPRTADFRRGIQLRAAYPPAWISYLGNVLQTVQEMGASQVVFTPTWTFRSSDPVIFETASGLDPLWPDLMEALQQTRDAGLVPAVYPVPRFPIEMETWWEEAPRDSAWWQNWFERYTHFALHHAELAEKGQAGALVLGGEWVTPALPGGTLIDGRPSGVPADAELRWRELLDQVRSRYSGEILWALPASRIATPPAFLDAVDEIYLLWPEDNGLPGNGSLEPAEAATRWLDTAVRPIQLLYARPVSIAAAYPSGEDHKKQVQDYERMLRLVNERGWIEGFVACDFYAPSPVQDDTASVHGKPAQRLLQLWFTGFRGETQP